jgi:nitrite reductase/ring-hydroxylating ferredoxin subunit
MVGCFPEPSPLNQCISLMSDQLDSCTSCVVAEYSRRQFLRDAGIAAAAALALVSAPSRLLAEPLRLIAAKKAGGALRSYPVPTTDGVSIDKDNEVILVRWQNAIYAFALSCPHQNTALHWEEDNKRFQCPKHHSKYRPDGTFIEGRATRGMDRYAITETASGVTVDVDKVFEQDAAEKDWSSAVVHV